MLPWHLIFALGVGSSLVALGAGVLAWRHRGSSPAAVPLVVLMGALSWWAGLDAAQLALPDGPLRRATLYLVVPVTGVVVAAFLCEARALVHGTWGPWRCPRQVLMVEPLVMVAVAFTNPWHHLFAEFPAASAGPWFAWQPGVLLWAHVAYGYAVLGWAFVTLALGLRRSTSPLHRRQLRSVVLAAMIATIGNLVTLTWTVGPARPDLTPAFLLVTGLVHYFAVFRQGLLRLLPIARELVVENVSDAIFVVDNRGIVVDLNPAGVRLARQLEPDRPVSLVGLPVRELLPPRDRRRMLSNGEYHASRPDGAELDLDLRVSDLADRHGRPLGRVVVARDVTELNDQRRRLADVNDQLLRQLTIIDDLRRELAELAVRDDLTGLYNRRHLMAQFERDLERARSDAAPLAVVLIDVDHFKSVNDRFGHAVGDILLTAIAKALAGSVRSGDTVARYGGEEFVVLLPGAGSEQAMACAEALRSRCATVLVDSRQGPVSTTVSVGVATFPDCGWTSAALLQSADEALYVAKGAGRDQVVAAFAQ